MAFINIPFAVFFLLVLCAFWLGRKRRTFRISVLILASYAFYASWNPAFAIIVLYASCLDFWIGKRLGRQNGSGRRKLLLAASILSNLVLLAAFKYRHLYLEPIAGITQGPGIFPAPAHLSIPFTVGISFYLLQTLSYTIDVYRRRIKPCDRLMDYLLYVAFFPRLLAGPIVRAGEFLPKLEEVPRLGRERRGLALFLLVSGVVKKLVFADYLAINLVDKVFDLPLLFSTTEVILAIYAYTVQLYCEFSGYTDIALALGLFLGLELPDNFRFPLKASNLREFWRRWFISLSSWFRDYLYIPLGGSRARWPKLVYLNLILTMVVVGLWNAPAFNCLLWGLLNGIALALTSAFHRLRNPGGKIPETAGWRRLIGVFLTFHFVVLSWAILRATDLQIVANLYTILRAGIWGAPNLTAPVAIVIGLALTGSWLPDRAYEIVKGLFTRLPLAVQIAVVVFIFLIVFKVSAAESIPFVYERF